MKKFREFVRDFIDNYPVLATIIFICIALCLFQESGLAAWSHRFVDSFWKYKGF